MSSHEYSVPVTPPDSDNELRIKGLSLLFYSFYVVNKDPELSLLELVTSSVHYNSMFDVSEIELSDYAIYRYLQAIYISPLELPHAGIVKGNAQLFFQVLGKRFLLVTTVLSVDISDDITVEDRRIQVAKPLKVDDILTLISELNHNEGSLHNYLENQRRRAVQACFGFHTILPVIPQRLKNTAIQIWSIDNLDISTINAIHGEQLAYKYAWELTALLQCNSDLIRVYKAWRKRRPEQVFALLGQGTDILADHRVLTYGAVCIEISQVNFPSLSLRSAQRLAVFGYDSTSIYLWSYLALQEFILGLYDRKFSEMFTIATRMVPKADIIEQQIDKKNVNHEDNKMSINYTVGREMLYDVVGAKVTLYQALDKSCWITTNMFESRHINFFTMSMKARNLDQMQLEVTRKLQELTSIATDIHQVFISMDQRNIMQDLKRLNQSTRQTNTRIDFLNFIVAAAQAAVLSEYMVQIFNILNNPLIKGVLGLGIFTLIALLYYFFSRRRKALVGEVIE